MHSALGNTANIKGTADQLLIDGGAIRSQSKFGNFGDITIQARDAKITGGGQIASSVFEEGELGKITVAAVNSLVIDGAGSGVFATAKVLENAGSIVVTARDLALMAGGQISASASGPGNGGNVNVTATSLLIDGEGSGIFAETTPFETVSFEGKPEFFVDTGNAGNVTVRASDLTITGGGAISSRTFASGDGGSVTVIADSLSIDGVGSGIFSDATPLVHGDFGGSNTDSFGNIIFREVDVDGKIIHIVGSGAGDAGNVMVRAGILRITGGGGISSSTFGGGNGGDMKVTADSLLIDGGDSGIFGGSFEKFGNSGTAGSISINTTGAVNLRHESSISTSSTLGDAGSIEISSGGEIKLSDQSSITVSAGRNGGNITISAPDLVYLIDSSITATAGAEQTTNGVGGKGGNITIDPQFIVLQNSFIRANAAIGQGGN